MKNKDLIICAEGRKDIIKYLDKLSMERTGKVREYAVGRETFPLEFKAAGFYFFHKSSANDKSSQAEASESNVVIYAKGKKESFDYLQKHGVGNECLLFRFDTDGPLMLYVYQIDFVGENGTKP